jgi:hypothetical protein
MISPLHPLAQDIARYMAYDATDAELVRLADDPGLVGECAKSELETRDADEEE